MPAISKRHQRRLQSGDKKEACRTATAGSQAQNSSEGRIRDAGRTETIAEDEDVHCRQLVIPRIKDALTRLPMKIRNAAAATSRLLCCVTDNGPSPQWRALIGSEQPPERVRRMADEI